MILRSIALPLLTGGALAALVAYAYTRRTKRLEMVRELILGRDPLGIPRTMSDALERAAEDVNVRSEAEAMAVSGTWTGNSAESPEPSVDDFNRASSLEPASLDALNEAIFRIDEANSGALDEDDLRVPHANELQKNSESIAKAAASAEPQHDVVDIDALAARWRPPATKPNG